MRETVLIMTGLAGIMLLSGCRSPEFAYNAPPAGQDPTGPSIVVLPLTDSRINHEADHVFNKGYLSRAQDEIGRELQSMKVFRSVAVATNEANLPNADLQLSLTLRRLDCEIPHHSRMTTEKTTLYAFQYIVGVPTGSMYSHFQTRVYGNTTLDAALRRTADQKLLLNETYSESVTNWVKKSDYNKSETKAQIILTAFEYTQTDLKSDLLKEVLQEKYGPAPSGKK